MKKLTYLGIIGCALIALPAAQGSAVFSENFTEVSGLAETGAFSNVFTVSSGNVDALSPTNFGFLCVSPEGPNCVDMDGNTQGAITTTAGYFLVAGTYFLDFDLIGSQRGNTSTTEVSLNETQALGTCVVDGTDCLYDSVFTLASGDDTDGIVAATITVTTPATYYLTISSDTPGVQASLLDDVALSNSIPEPASIVLCMAGLGALALKRWHGRRS